jgi:hypothetical protein
MPDESNLADHRKWRASAYRAEALSLWEVLGEEYWRAAKPDQEIDNCADLEYLEAFRRYKEERRLARDADQREGDAGSEPAELAFRKVLIERLHARKATALCLSGGGIRSTTFGLGVLQGLAKHSWSPAAPDQPLRLLGELDYLSTVSGGGHLGGWFSSWAARHKEGACGVIRELGVTTGTAAEPLPVRNLRRFIHNLNPQLGLFSADAWALLTTVVRNIVLNWMVLIPLLAAILVVPRLFFALVEAYPFFRFEFLLYGAAAMLVTAAAHMVVTLPSAGNARLPQSRYIAFGLVPLLLAAFCFALYWPWGGDVSTLPGPARFVEYGTLLMAAGVLAGMPFAIWKRFSFQPRWLLQGAGFAIITGTVGGILLYWMVHAFSDPYTGDLYDDRLYAWLSLPILLGVFAASQVVLLAIIKAMPDEDREWFSRSIGWIFIVLVCCWVFNGIALLTPVLADQLPAIKWQWGLTFGVGFLASRLAWSPKSPAAKDDGDAKSPSSMSAPEFIASALLGYAVKRAGLDSSATKAGVRFLTPLTSAVFVCLLIGTLCSFDERASQTILPWLPNWNSSGNAWAGVIVELLLIALLSIPALLLSRNIDANEVSLHPMYRLRLIRTFLGASNQCRRPDPFTGFDPSDNLLMADLPAKPLLLINATLNFVEGQNVGLQRRKAESFTVTRHHSGSWRLGYRPSSIYAGGMTLGSAMTISGAATSPDLGYSPSPLSNVIMRLFNAGLAVFLPNPGPAGRDSWFKVGPAHSVRPFIDEAFGLNSNKSAWVKLSDGGHFEDLGLYEMVLRRCATVIVVDGTTDSDFHFDALANAVRKIRVDTGIAIEFPGRLPISKAITENSKHCAVGRVCYAAVDGPSATDGTLIYIKASLTGNEPSDIWSYAAQNPAFPQQPTVDQQFDEAQFESYRRLGYHIIEEILQFRDGNWGIQEFAESARQYSS